jgi:energy-coupling factor transport system permease protein
MRMVPTYRFRPSALHSARAGAAASFCCALALVGALFVHPLVLASVIGAALLAGTAAGVGGEVVRALKLSLPLALLVALINPLVYQGGDTLLVRGGVVLGRRFDVTLEALVTGLLFGLRVAAIVAALGLLSAAVDPDELLKVFRRVSYRSALTASLATRLVPVLARDATRMNDAARCRPVPPGRLAVARAALSGALDRAVEVAAALEVRGYSGAVRPQATHRPWSRHDLRVAAAAVLLACGSVAFSVLGAASFESYPRLEMAVGPLEIALCCLVLGAAALPFAGRSARMGVARA